MDHNIALLPDSGTTQALIDLSRVIDQKVGSQIRLGLDNTLPHLTLYLTCFPRRNLSELDRCLKAISSASAPLEIQVKGWTMSNNGSVLLNCGRSKELLSLHEKVIDFTNPLREELLADVWTKNMAHLTKQQLRLLNTVGFPYARELWIPHFTVSTIDPHSIEVIQALLDVFEGRFYAKELSLCSSNERGVVVEKLKGFEFEGFVSQER